MNKQEYIKLAVEEIGLPDYIPMSVLSSAISYVDDNTRLLPIGIEGEICEKVRLLYYSGYTDLGHIKGTVQIFKDLESTLSPLAAAYGNAQREEYDSRIIDVSTFLRVKDISRRMFVSNERRRTKITNVMDLTPFQLADPAFAYKFQQQEFRYNLPLEKKLDTVLVVEDGSASMLRGSSLEKLAGVLSSVQAYYSDIDIIKIRGYGKYFYKTEVLEIPEKGETVPFHLNTYLSKLTIKYDLIIICTDALEWEFDLFKISDKTILFNLGVHTYKGPTNITQVRI